MVKKCEVCGRPLKTGRKYCFEHRNKANSKEFQETILLNKSEKLYPIWKYKNKRWTLFLIQTIFIISWIIYLELSNMGMLEFFILGGCLSLLITVIYKAIIKMIAKKEIINHTSNYKSFLKTRLSSQREDYEFMKSVKNSF